VSTFNASNVHGIVHNNTTHYKNMVMDAMRMNQNHVGQFPVVDEEPNADAARFFNILKDFDKQYMMVAKITVNYWSLHIGSPSSQIMG